MPRSRAPLKTLWGLGLTALTAFAGASCDNDISCVFTTGCSDNGSGGPGPLATQPATLPEDGQLVRAGVPVVRDVMPSGDAASTTPIVLEFSESMNPATVVGSVQVSQSFGQTVPTVQQLTADGRVLIVLPSAPLPPGDYVVRFVGTAQVTDLTGQELVIGGDLTSFTVVDPNPAGPLLLTSFPRAGATDVDQTTELVFVFDRPLDATTVSDATVDVQVNGSAPIADPPAMALTTAAGAEPRILIYRSEDVDEVPQPLGAGATVSVTLGSGLMDLTGEAFQSTTLSFTTAAFRQPLGASLLSSPPDAIGLANLTSGANELAVQVELLDAEPGDRLDLLVFGADPDPMGNGDLLAFLRTIQLDGTAPITSATLSLADIDLQDGGSPRVADGPVSFAFRLRRGDATSPLTVLDADGIVPGIQDLLLDTVPPTIQELQAGVIDRFRSDQRGLVLSGRADEEISSVEVTSTVGDNLTSGALSPAVGSDLSGLFVAAPVGMDLFPAGTIAYDVTVYDQANNPSTTTSGLFSQHGVVGPDAFVPGDTLAVEVFDTTTLQPLAGALVATHADAGDGTYPFSASADTDVDGLANVTTAAAAVGALVTVELAGYDLFTFQGVTSTRLSIGLSPIGAGASAAAVGSVTTQSPLASLLELNVLDVRVADSRFALSGARSIDAQDCIDLFSLALACAFGPEPVRTARLGAASALVGDFLIPDEASYTALGLVEGFELVVPRPALGVGDSDQYDPDLPFLYQEPNLEPTELPVDVQAVLLDAAGQTGLDRTMLDGDPTTTGEPRVTLETLIPGIPGSLAVGVGLAFEQVSGGGGELWRIRSAHSGSVTAGFFAQQGVVDPDLFLRAELRDLNGNRSVRRPRISQLGSLPVPDTLEPLDVPVLLLPGGGGSAGGASFQLSFADVLPDAQGVAGLYRVRLVDGDGRGWDLWRVDPADAGGGTVTLEVPDLSATASVGLAAGDVDAVLELWGWSGFDPSTFLWSDLEREYDVFVAAQPVSFSIP